MPNTFLRTLRRVTVVAILVAALMAMFSCYPNGPQDAEEFDVVATFYDQDADFSVFSNFASRTDSIHQVDIGGAENLQLSHDHDAEILALINQKFTDRGYTRENDPATNRPDMAVLVAAAATTEYDPYASSPWFSYWGTWFSDSLEVDADVTWGLDYSWYSGSVVYSYDVGSLVIMLLDIRNIDDQTARADIPVLWMGTFNALLSGNEATIVGRVEKGIDQMFEQSQYLRKQQ